MENSTSLGINFSFCKKKMKCSIYLNKNGLNGFTKTNSMLGTATGQKEH